jgi:hypothetical protein
MIGVYKNKKKLPFISLEKFVNEELLIDAMNELETYKLKQDTNNCEIFIGYNGVDWNTNTEFQIKQRKNLPKTWNYILSFIKEDIPFNIRWSAKEENSVLLHRDLQPILEHTKPWESLEQSYKSKLTNSYYEVLKNKNNFKITSVLSETNPEYNLIDFDYETNLKNEFGIDYLNNIKNSYKLHMVMSNTKTLFVYDNVTDTIHDFNSRIAIFNARDFHDTFLNSWGISIQFPMYPHFLKDEILEYLEIK